MVRRLVLAHGLALAGVGLTAGTLLSLVLTRALATLIDGTGSADPLVLAVVVLALLLVAFVACPCPHGRPRVDPVRTLRRTDALRTSAARRTTIGAAVVPRRTANSVRHPPPCRRR